MHSGSSGKAINGANTTCTWTAIGQGQDHEAVCWVRCASLVRRRGGAPTRAMAAFLHRIPMKPPMPDSRLHMAHTGVSTSTSVAYFFMTFRMALKRQGTRHAEKTNQKKNGVWDASECVCLVCGVQVSVSICM
jgi:hypothetical protein